MRRLEKADGFDNEQLFVIPGKFLADLSLNPLSQFLSVTDIGYFPSATFHYRRRPEGCKTAIIIYCKAGEGFYSINNSPTKALSTGQLIVIPPDTPHTYRASEQNPWTIYWVHVQGPFFDAFYENVITYCPICLSDILGEQIKDMFNRCFSILHMPYQIEDFLYLCQIVATMLTLINCAKQQSSNPLTKEGNLALDRTITFMYDHIHERVSLNQLSTVAQVCQSQLTYLFKKSTGFAPIEYFLRTKTQAASRDLCFTKLPILDIAATYGFEDSCYFSRLFKKIMGLSPKNYRNIIADKH